MYFRQQQILHAIGVQQWISRDAVVQKKPSSIWRDVADATPLDNHHQATTTISTVSLADDNLSAKIAHPNIDQLDTDYHPDYDTNFETDHTDTTLQQPVITADATPLQAVHYSNDLSLLLQVCQADNFLLIATVESEKQQQLWINIQQSLKLTAYPLLWPLNINWFSHDALLQDYLKGFFYVHPQPILLLGECEAIESLQLDHFSIAPSLEQCLENFEHKKLLWQKIYTYLSH
ncbi:MULTISPECIES: hypothetical protein [unclassified Acinetobacter]|uniref:hypothetical protein n=1 Tax=unclassified Acinetobacter TaxID=196816 RepID=UPI0035B9D925